MHIVKLDTNASMMNARKHASLTKLVFLYLAHTVTLITKFVTMHVQEIQIVLEDTPVLKKDA